MDTVIGTQMIGEGVNLTLYNSPSLVLGISGQALSFNGINQYATISSQIHPCIINPGDTNCQNGMTFSFWLKRSSQTGRHFDYISFGCRINRLGVCFNQAYGYIGWTIGGGPRYFRHTVLSNELPYDTWLCIGSTWSETYGLQVYVDGESLAEYIPPTTRGFTVTAIASTFYFGRSANNNTLAWAKFAIDEFYFWPEVKCADFMRFLYEYNKA